MKVGRVNLFVSDCPYFGFARLSNSKIKYGQIWWMRFLSKVICERILFNICCLRRQGVGSKEVGSSEKLLLTPLLPTFLRV
jgi:hypothetical protein